VLEALNLRGGISAATAGGRTDVQPRRLSPKLARASTRPLAAPARTAAPDGAWLTSALGSPAARSASELCRAEAPFSPALEPLLPQIGQQLGVVMENATLFEDALRREALSTNLGRLSLAISAQLDRDTVLNLICRESIAVFEAQGAYIWLIESGELIGAAATGLAEDRFLGHRIDLRSTERLPARVLHAWQAEYVNHVADSDALDPDFVQMIGAKSVIAVPLLKADIPIGTLLLVNTENADAFAGWQTEQIGLLGVQAALAIQNATLFIRSATVDQLAGNEVGLRHRDLSLKADEGCRQASRFALHCRAMLM